MSEGTQRRLAAIVAADVVGYSRLMGVDEDGTLAALKAHRRELVDPKVAEHRGRIVKTTGDGILLEFASVLDAVRCCIEVQQGMAERNAGEPDDRRMLFRVGINLGDIIIDGDDIHGDGVNVAARLEALAEAGDIAISGNVHEQVQGKTDAQFTDDGLHEVKNIAKPVQVWRWSPLGTPAGSAQEIAGGDALPLPDKPSIAVMSFDNMSGDREQEFFADGMAEEIITALSKISQLRVIARNSTFVYKGQAIDLRRVANELGVRYVMEGSIRKGGDRLRITAQLIDASDGSHVWAERFDRTIDDLFDIQDEITKEIVTALRIKLTDGEEARLWGSGTTDIEAWQLCVRATELIERWNTSDYLEARTLAENALAHDPNYAYAWATLGYTFWHDGRVGHTGDAEAKIARAKECAERALELDNNLPWALGLSNVVAGSQNRAFEALAIARRSVELYPGIAHARAHLGLALTRAGDFAEGAEHFRAAISLSPFCPNWYRNGLGRVLLLLSEFDEALALFDAILEAEPTHLHSWLQKAYILSQTGRLDEAANAMKEVRQFAPNLRLKHVPELLMVSNNAIVRRLLGGLRAAGLPE